MRFVLAQGTHQAIKKKTMAHKKDSVFEKVTTGKPGNRQLLKL